MLFRRIMKSLIERDIADGQIAAVYYFLSYKIKIAAGGKLHQGVSAFIFCNLSLSLFQFDIVDIR